MTPTEWRPIAAAISAAIGEAFEPTSVSGIGGGCINNAVQLADERRRFFVKTNDRSALEMFEAERDGLEALAAPGCIKVPAPVVAGTAGEIAYLAVEYVAMKPLTGDCWRHFGERLAALHRTGSPDFGWHRDNTIGATIQVNDRSEDWIEFWRRSRLGIQLDLAAGKGLDGDTVRRGQLLMASLDALFEGHDPRPSLLHGDLWGGNVAADAAGSPVIYDPAVYFGDREADIAMTEMFGRFDSRFYEAYESAWPLDAGYGTRKTLYNLYHVLNHYNLFGGGYGSQARSMIDSLLERVQR